MRRTRNWRRSRPRLPAPPAHVRPCPCPAPPPLHCERHLEHVQPRRAPLLRNEFRIRCGHGLLACVLAIDFDIGQPVLIQEKQVVQLLLMRLSERRHRTQRRLLLLRHGGVKPAFTGGGPVRCRRRSPSSSLGRRWRPRASWPTCPTRPTCARWVLGSCKGGHVVLLLR